MRRLAVALVALAVAGCLPTDPAPVPVDPDAAALVERHNAERESRGLPAYAWDARLQQAAQAHADHMAQVGRMAHSGIGDGSPAGRIRAAGYPGGSTAENVAWNYPDVPAAMRGWLSSPGHRAAILSRSSTAMGAAVAHGKGGSPYWCTTFGRDLP